MSNDSEKVRRQVREGYAAIAQAGSLGVADTAETSQNEGGSCCGGGGCCGPTMDVSTLAASIGYAENELAGLPEGANMGLSCGNPTALAQLAPGEVVLDLGSGGGLDLFVAGPRLGAEGRAIGVDMTPEMVSKARAGLEVYRRRTGLDNVEFRLGEIEHLPVADASVDVVISNCVINLSPDKPQVWREISRVLKPGGRVAVSDLALLKPLPPEVADMIEALVGCVSGAVLVEETRRQAADAGLKGIELQQRTSYIEAMTGFNDPLYAKIMDRLPEGAAMSDYITSLEITARKPA